MPLINAHEHLQSREELPKMLRGMDACDIERVVVLGSSAFTITSDYRLGFTQYRENNEEILAAARAHADRLEAWPTLDPMDPDKLDHLRRYHQSGATGLKLYLGHGYVAPGASEYLFSSVAMDNPRMDSVYEYCSTHHIPVCLHINPGAQTPGFADEFVAVLERHPRLLVNAPHWALSTRRPSRLAELLDVFPSVVTDVSFGVDEFLIAGLRRISRNPAPMRRVVERYTDRILFGTDFVVTNARHKTPEWMCVRVHALLAMLGRGQYESPLMPGEVLNGLALPETIMRQIGFGNYLAFRSPERQLATSTRPVDWRRMGVPRVQRRPGERLSREPESVAAFSA